MYFTKDYVTVQDLIGETIGVIREREDEVVILCHSGRVFTFDHQQDCCESVTVTEVRGIDLVGGATITDAKEEIISPERRGYESATDSTFTLITEKGDLVIKFHGESNGYYSETVTISRSN